MGMEFRPYYLAREWVRMGHEVVIVAGDYSHLRQVNPSVTGDFQEENIDGIRYVWVRTGSYEGNGAARAFTMFRFVGKLWSHAAELVKRYRPDVVIASSTYPLDTYAAQRVRSLSGAKYVHEVHDMWPSTLYEIGGMSRRHPFVQLMQMAEDSAYRNCEALVSLPPLAKDYMVEHGLAPEKFTAVQNGVVLEDWENPDPLPREHVELFDRLAGRFIVGYAGGHALSNALDVLLDTAKLLDSSEVEFVLVGDGAEKRHLQDRAEFEAIKNVHFLPPVPKCAVPSLLDRFDCCIACMEDSPLYRFGLSLNKQFDYMMAAKPIIFTANVPGGVLSEFHCGMEIPCPPVSNIAEAIEMLAELSGESRRELGERGRRAALENFTYERLAKKFLRAIDEA